MNQTNINIVSSDKTFKYIIEYIPQEIGVNVDDIYYEVDGRRIDFFTSSPFLKRVENDWFYHTPNNQINTYIPNDLKDLYKTAKIRVYFPEYSLNTYNLSQQYIITANTWIMNRIVYFGSFILNRSDALACNEIKIINGEKYLEYIDFEILDPYDLIYSDKWIDFRKKICGERYLTPILNNDYVYKLIDIMKRLYPYDFNWDFDDDFNSFYNQLCDLEYSISAFIEHEDEFTRYNRVLRVLREIILKIYEVDFNNDFCDDFNIDRGELTFTKILQIIQKFEPSDFNNDYNEDYAHIDIPFSDGSDKLVHNDTSSIINFSMYPVECINDEYIKISDYEGGHNAINIYNDNGYLNTKLSVNSQSYNTEPTIDMSISFNKEYHENLKFYLYETYGMLSDSHTFEIVVKDKDNIYYGPLTRTTDSSNISFSKEEIQSFRHEGKLPMFESNDQYIDGCFLAGSVTFHDNNDKKDITITTNQIPLTMEIYSYLCKNNLNLKGLDINNIDMTTYNINAINKIINNVIQIDTPSDSKSNIIAPVFFKANDIGNVTIHSAVTENICINLDAYKSKVDVFYLQIEGVKFPEIGRTSNGVIFKVFGSQLPKAYESGTLYIVNEESELITTGKYTYSV